MSGYDSTVEFFQASAYGEMPQEVRSAGSLGAQFIDLDMPAHDLTDAPISDLVIQFITRGAPDARYHLGDRWITNPHGAGSLMVAPPDTEVAYDVPTGGQILILALPMRQLQTALGAQMLDPHRVLGPVFESPFRDPALFAMAGRMWAEAARDDSASALFVDSAALALVAGLMRQAGVAPDPPRGGPTRKMLGRVAEYVEAYLDRPIGLDDMAGAAHLSSYHFHRVFRAATGLTPHQYVTARRIERAKRLLTTEMPLIQVAMACGFASQSHFGEVFKANVGATPGRWRKGA
jgi:AraC family transcriptional regulator